MLVEAFKDRSAYVVEHPSHQETDTPERGVLLCFVFCFLCF